MKICRLYGIRAALKWAIALTLSRLAPYRYCWAGLVAWALADGPFPPRTALCHDDGACWCGLFREEMQ